MYILIYFLGIIGFLVILNNPIIFFLLALISIFLTLFLVQSRIFFFYLITLLIALKPITIDLFFWNKYIFGFKATHIFSVSLIILAFFLIFKLKVKITKFNLWILPTIYFLYHFFITLFSIQYGIIFGSLDYFLRNCAGVPFFFLIGHLLENEKDYKKQ